MTVAQAISRFDLLYPNSLTTAQKTDMLSLLDGKVFEEILSLYPNAPASFTGYNALTDQNTALLLPFPYDDLYIKFLSMQNDFANGDIARYNNAASLFNRSYEEYAHKMNRTHTKKVQTAIKV